MNFVAVDLILLVLFVLIASVFLYAKRNNLKKEGALFLYKTSWGIKLINHLGGKYKKSLKFLSYISICTGYILMAGIIYLMGNSVYIYFTSEIAKTIKAPPIAPLIPYFPKLFGLQSFFPPFYFVYFLIAIVIVATVHEFSHGIFARRFGVRIKSTGFVFLKYFPALFGAFVEQDDEQMKKSKKFEQMSILSAGVFANVLVAILFYIILFGFFTFTFIPVGVQFDSYAYSSVNADEIASVNDILVNSYQEVISNAKEDTNVILTKDNQSYVASKEMLIAQESIKENIMLYYNSPAVTHKLQRIITEINKVRVTSFGKMQEEFENYSPGDKIIIKTTDGENEFSDEITLGEHPDKKGKPWLGIGFSDNSQGKISRKILSLVPSYKKPFVYYKPKNDFTLFAKDLLWWIFIINVLVALFNMLPLGILDGGRFFYLSILGITKSEKTATRSFKFLTFLILFLIMLLIIKWLFGFF